MKEQTRVFLCTTTRQGFIGGRKSLRPQRLYPIWLLVLPVLFNGLLLGEEGQPVREIRRVLIEGNEAVEEGKILKKVRSLAGSELDLQQVAEDARRIMAMPEIYHVEWALRAVGQEVDLVFQVRETAQIEEVEFLGNKHLSRKKLLDKLQYKKGDFLDLYLIHAGAETLKEYYREKGYYFVQVRVNEEVLKNEGKVVYAIIEGPKMRVKKVRFEGNRAFTSGKLKSKIRTGGYIFIFRKGLLDDEQLELDELALRTFYQNEGYLDARVFSEKRFNKKRTRLDVVFVIEEGTVYVLKEIRFEGNEQFSDEQLRETIKLKVGRVLTNEKQILAQRAVEREYGREGFIYSRVTAELEYTEEEGEVNLVFKIREDSSYLLGRLIVKGNYHTQDKVVRREFDRYEFLPGKVFDTYAKDRAKRRLEGSGLFESVEVTPVGNEEASRDALVEVQEARTGMIIFGVGVDTDSGVVGNFSINQRNFDFSDWPDSVEEFLRGEAFKGAGQRLRLDIEPGTKETRGNLSFHEPYLFDQPYYLDLNLFIFRRWRESYLERRQGANLLIGHRFGRDWSADVRWRVERISIVDLDEGTETLPDGNKVPIVAAPEDVQDVEGHNLLTSVKFGVGCDTTDRMFRPTEGYKLSASWEQAGAMGGAFTYGVLSAGASLYHTLYEDLAERRTVWANSVQVNKIYGDAPVFERFYAGGLRSMRGFDYRGVSPRDSRFNDPIGSDLMFLGRTEVSQPLHEELIYGKLFCDSGLVSEGPYRVTLGFGIELLVPQLFQMVPMHFDFGFPVVYDDDDDKETFSFSIGLTF